MFDWFINQSIFVKTILAGMFTFSLTSLGASIVFLFKNNKNKIFLDFMLSLSAGIMLAASFWSLIEPSFSIADSLNLNSILVVSLGILAGTTLLYLGDCICNIKFKESKGKKRILLLIASITIHNIPEGLAIGVAFGSLNYNIAGASLLGAISLTIGIGLQNIPEGSAISLPLRREGYGRFKSFLIGSISALVEPISAILGALLVLKIRYILPFFLALAGGAMIYVVIKELIPESQKNDYSDIMTVSTIIGFLIMMILDVTL